MKIKLWGKNILQKYRKYTKNELSVYLNWFLKALLNREAQNVYGWLWVILYKYFIVIYWFRQIMSRKRLSKWLGFRPLIDNLYTTLLQHKWIKSPLKRIPRKDRKLEQHLKTLGFHLYVESTAIIPTTFHNVWSHEMHCGHSWLILKHINTLSFSYFIYGSHLL